MLLADKSIALSEVERTVSIQIIRLVLVHSSRVGMLLVISFQNAKKCIANLGTNAVIASPVIWCFMHEVDSMEMVQEKMTQ